MTAANVPPEAIAAAENWQRTTHLSKYSPGYLPGLLEAAAPLIAAAERDRIIAVALHDAAVAEHQASNAAGSVAAAVLRLFAEHLRGLREEPAGPDGPDTGHGHVRPRPDGVKARCGGPGLCAECSREAAAIQTQQTR